MVNTLLQIQWWALMGWAGLRTQPSFVTCFYGKIVPSQNRTFGKLRISFFFFFFSLLPVFFFFKDYLFIYLFIFGCIGS